MKVLSIFGTRPEAIKMAPVIRALDNSSNFESLVCVTAQHRNMLDNVLELFQIRPDFDLNIMKADQNLTYITVAVLKGLEDVLLRCKPDRILVHGDTTTTLAASLAAFYANIPVAHIEAGLRSGNLKAPWPEELNRCLCDNICDLLFPPTVSARQNLLDIGISEKNIFVTGNTVIDALLHVSKLLDNTPNLNNEVIKRFPALSGGKDIILVTGHRRESFGEGFNNICDALTRLSDRTDVHIIYPVHLNPKVQDPVRQKLGGIDNIQLTEPLEYLPFVALMKASKIIITDSGGIQEEAPSLGKPVLVMREVTERTEALEAGTVKLVGTDQRKIFGEATRLLDDPVAFHSMCQSHNPYGDGQASARILNELLNAN